MGNAIFPTSLESQDDEFGPGVDDIEPGWHVHENYGIPVAECPKTFQTKYLTQKTFNSFKDKWLAFVKRRYPDREIRNDYGDVFNPYTEYQIQYPMLTNDRLRDLTLNSIV